MKWKRDTSFRVRFRTMVIKWKRDISFKVRYRTRVMFNVSFRVMAT